MGLGGRHALVTGGGRGIGRAVAHALTAAGARVTVTGRSEGPLIETVGSGDAEGYATVDATEETDVLHAFRQAVAARGPIDILVANAGAAESAPFLKADSAMFRRMIDLNLMGVVHAARAVLPDMLTRGMAASSPSPRRRASRVMPMSRPMWRRSMRWSASPARWRWRRRPQA